MIAIALVSSNICLQSQHPLSCMQGRCKPQDYCLERLKTCFALHWTPCLPHVHGLWIWNPTAMSPWFLLTPLHVRGTLSLQVLLILHMVSDWGLTGPIINLGPVGFQVTFFSLTARGQPLPLTTTSCWIDQVCTNYCGGTHPSHPHIWLPLHVFHFLFCCLIILQPSHQLTALRL